MNINDAARANLYVTMDESGRYVVRSVKYGSISSTSAKISTALLNFQIVLGAYTASGLFKNLEK